MFTAGAAYRAAQPDSAVTGGETHGAAVYWHTTQGTGGEIPGQHRHHTGQTGRRSPGKDLTLWKIDIWMSKNYKEHAIFSKKPCQWLKRKKEHFSFFLNVEFW